MGQAKAIGRYDETPTTPGSSAFSSRPSTLPSLLPSSNSAQSSSPANSTDAPTHVGDCKCFDFLWASKISSLHMRVLCPPRRCSHPTASVLCCSPRKNKNKSARRTRLSLFCPITDYPQDQKTSTSNPPHSTTTMGVLDVLTRKSGVIVGDDVLKLFNYAQEHNFAIPAIVSSRSASAWQTLTDCRISHPPPPLWLPSRLPATPRPLSFSKCPRVAPPILQERYTRKICSFIMWKLRCADKFCYRASPMATRRPR